MEDFMSRATIKVIGVGGAGGNAINDMIESGISGVEFIAANTDSQDLEISRANHKIKLGERATKGLGAGADPDIGKNGAEESKDRIRNELEGTDMLFITAGMGGGTGTGAAPVIAELAKELGILTVGIVTRPFSFEGPQRKKNADKGIENLRKHVDTLIAIPNDKLFELPNMNITLMNAFKEANNILRSGVKGISELITKQGYINLDFADIKAIMQNSGIAMLGFGEAQGEGRARIATELALSSPLLEKSIEGAKKILLNITGGLDLGLTEIQEVSMAVTSKSGSLDANLIFGTVIDETVEGIKVSIVATDFQDERVSKIDTIFSTSSTGASTTQSNNSISKPAYNGKLIDSSNDDDTFIVPDFLNK